MKEKTVRVEDLRKYINGVLPLEKAKELGECIQSSKMLQCVVSALRMSGFAEKKTILRKENDVSDNVKRNYKAMYKGWRTVKRNPPPPNSKFEFMNVKDGEVMWEARGTYVGLDKVPTHWREIRDF